MRPSEALVKGRELLPEWAYGKLVTFEYGDDTSKHLSKKAVSGCALGAMWAGYYGRVPQIFDNLHAQSYWWNDWEELYVQYPCNEAEGVELVARVIAHLSDAHHERFQDVSSGTVYEVFTEEQIIEWLKGLGL
jgi:hypothetical protein